MSSKLRLFVALVISVAVAFLLLIDWTTLATLSIRDYMGLGVFVALAALSEHLAVESGTSRRVRSSIAFLPLLAATLVFPVSAVICGIALMYAVTRTRGGSRFVAAFNLAQLILAYGTAAKVFQVLTGEAPLGGPIDQFLLIFFPFYAAAIAYFGLNILLISGYLAIRDEQPIVAVIAEATGKGGGNLLYDVLASPIALLVAYLYTTLYVAGLVSVVFPLLLIRYSYLSALELERTNRDLLLVFVKAIETRDPYTSGHSVRVAALAKAIGADLGIRGRTLDQIETAALLHDIGKIDALYAEIISKDSSLTVSEREVIQTHAVRGADLLETLSSLDKDIIIGVRHHHERYDGTGYPNGLAGKAIPIAARIIMICDAVDAMLSDRPYRRALSIADVRSELAAYSGTQFDPDIVNEITARGSIERAELLVDRSGARAIQKAAVV